MTSASKKFLDEFVVVMGLGYQKNMGNLPGNILEVLKLAGTSLGTNIKIPNFEHSEH